MFVLGAGGFTLASWLCAVPPTVAMLDRGARRPGRRRGDAHARAAWPSSQASFDPRRPWPGDRRVVRARRGGHGDRAVPRRLARRRRVVALDLPAQRAARDRRRRGRAPRTSPRVATPTPPAASTGSAPCSARSASPALTLGLSEQRWLAAVVGVVAARRVRAHRAAHARTRSCRWRCSGRGRSAARTS